MSDYSKSSLSNVASQFAVQLETAVNAVVRLDEQVVRLGRVGEGYRSRSDFQEACALRAIAGELVPIDDLVLVDAGAPIRLSSIELTRARIILQARRSAGADLPSWVWSDAALFSERVDVPRDELLKALGEVEWDEDERADQWRKLLAGLPPLPVMIRAAVAWDAWLQIDPLHGGAWRSALMAAAVMREGGLTLHHQFALGIGARRSRYRYDGRSPLVQRMGGFLDWVTQGALAGQAELKRLSLAHQVLGQVAKSKHVDSRLPALIDLVLSRPLISAEIAQRELKLTSTGFRRLREQLGTSVKELSGRNRYQVWGIL
ncbi:DUF1612 domain-containing protein [Reyranella sp.]|uniref:DUF1612 domain-containing protein n=1 Tax=Reyranella sp. TaxID=1929291 RepID=UPI0025CFC321|nr:DUF1612 domain-containing protein [Reyranella sp.]